MPNHSSHHRQSDVSFNDSQEQEFGASSHCGVQLQLQPHQKQQQQRHLRWMASVTLLVAFLGLPQPTEAFSSSLPRTAFSRVGSSSGSSALPSLNSNRLSSRLSVLASTEPSTQEVSTAPADGSDLEALRGSDGIYNIVTKEQHR